MESESCLFFKDIIELLSFKSVNQHYWLMVRWTYWLESYVKREQNIKKVALMHVSFVSF